MLVRLRAPLLHDHDPRVPGASVIKKLIGNLAELDYPTDRLEVLILVEADDEETLDALRTATLPTTFRWWSSLPPSPGRSPRR